MTPAQLIHRATAAGIVFSLTPSGRLRLGGDPEAINLWLGEIGASEAELIAELSEWPANECGHPPQGVPNIAKT